MQLGLGYPRGPLAMGNRWGPTNILEVLFNMQTVYGDPRYRPSPWLRRRGALGLSLLHDDKLWSLVNGWLAHLSEEHFVQLLPLLRRTIATFSAPERQQIAAKVGGQRQQQQTEVELDLARANLVLPVLRQIFGIQP